MEKNALDRLTQIMPTTAVIGQNTVQLYLSKYGLIGFLKVINAVDDSNFKFCMPEEHYPKSRHKFCKPYTTYVEDFAAMCTTAVGAFRSKKSQK